MPRYRVLKDGVVLNRIQWCGHAQYNPGEGCTLELDPDPVGMSRRLDIATDEALAADDDHLFSDTDDITEKQALEADLAQTREQLAIALEENAALKAREPEVRIVERVVEVSSPEAAPLKIIPDEIAAMMDPGDTFSPEVRRKLTERLNVELAELKNLRGLAGEDLKREAEIEKLLGLFARLGEI